MFEIVAPLGTGSSPHLPMETDAFYHVLHGTVEMLLGDDVSTASQGDFVFVPKATPHAWRVISETARLLHLRTPSGFERGLQLFGERTEANTPPSTDWTPQPIDQTRSQQLFEELGFRPFNMKW